MAAIDDTRTAFGSATVARHQPGFIASVIGGLVSWNDARVTRKTLNTLTDRELDDIGLVRGDIDNVAIGKR